MSSQNPGSLGNWLAQLCARANFGPPSDTLSLTCLAWAEAAQLGPSGVMMDPESREHLIASYLRHLDYQRMAIPTSREEMKRASEELRQRVETDPYFEAWEELENLCHDEPTTALSVILDLLSRCQDEDLGTIGAGPTESVVWKHAPTLVERIAQLLKSNDRFFEAYQCVRMGGVPLGIQRQLNNILVERGVPRESICEFPESYDFDHDDV